MHPFLFNFKDHKQNYSKLCNGSFLRLPLLFAFLTTASLSKAQAPPGFVEEQIGGEWNAAVGLTFTDDGEDMFVWEKGGKVWAVKDGEKAETPLIDLTNEVGDWGDHGLLGFALDPSFDNNGYIYLLYVVDRNYLMTGGTGSYNPSVTSENEATIGRVTRYKVSTTNGTMAADMNSRKVLIGESKSTGIPILYVSHGVGSLAFGEDGSLLVSAGDGATANGKDTGWKPGDATDNFVKQSLEDGILTQVNNVGALRAQQVHSLNGKILRIDPATGNGLASNPFYKAASPRAAESRVWALGLRNPFRFTLRPGTGSSSNPGHIYIGDVGWQDWEEINVATTGGLNFGWPLYEGLEEQQYYFYTGVPTPDLANPLFGTGGCSRETFYFNELIVQPKLNTAPYFGNYCDYNTPIPANVPTFVHTRPVLDWVNAVAVDGVEPAPVTRTGSFNGAEAAVVSVGAPGSPVSGEPFYGSSSTGGIWYTGNDLPAEYKNTYFFGDYGAGWIKVLKFDSDNKPTAVKNFIDEGATVTAFATNPATGGLYYINYGSQIRKIAYYDGNTPPKAVAEADKLYGASPLTVRFTGNKSTDAEGQLTYEWDFGDGSAKVREANPSHTFQGGTGVKVFNVTLKVTDSEGLTATAKLKITLNNTPPVVNVVSPLEGATYPMGKLTTYNLRAEVTDGEDTDAQLKYEWQVALYHNTHSHPEPVDTKHETAATVAAIGCDGETYFYRFSLKVTDSGGLTATDHVDVYPDCSGGVVAAVSMASPANNAAFATGAPVRLSVNFADKSRTWAKVEYFANGTTPIGAVTAAPYAYTWSQAPAGTYSITARATDSGGHTVESAPVNIVVGDGGVADLSGCLPGIMHYFGLDEEAGGAYNDFASTAVATCATCPEPVEGKFMKAQRFNGTDAGIDIKDVAQFNWGAKDDFSVNFWFRTTATTTDNAVMLGRDASGLHWWIGLNAQGQAMFMLKDVAHAGILLGDKGPKLNDGNWHKLTAIRDGASNKNKLYIDGELIQEQEYQYANNFVGETPINVGYLNMGGGYRFNGDIDELKVYDRALTQTEVVERFNGGNGTYCGPDPLGITDNETFAGTFEVYPNPTEGKQLNIFVSMLTPNEEVRLVLTDLTGKTVLNHTANARPDGTLQVTVLPKKEISSGLYNLLLYSTDRQLYRKVLVSH